MSAGGAPPTSGDDLGRPARWRALVRRLDPVTPLVGIVTAVVYTLHGFGAPLTRDLAIYAYAGQQVADGHPPYLGILNRAGPLAHLLPGIGCWVGRRLGASSDVFSMRFSFMLMAAAAVAVTYALGRDLLGSRAWGLVAAVTLMGLDGWVHYASGGPREKTAMVLFLVLALHCVVHQRWLATGLLLSLATLTWQPAFVVVAGVGAAVLVGVDGWRARGRAALRIAAGGLLPAVVFVVWYAAIGELRTLVDDFYLINATYTQQSGYLDLPRWGLPVLENGYGALAWVLLTGWAGGVVAAVVVLARRGRTPRDAGIVAVGMAIVAGSLWNLVAFNGWPDLFFMLPMGALGVAILLRAVTTRLDRRLVWAVAAAWVVVLGWTGVQHAVTSNRDGLALQERGTEAVLSRVPAGSTILALNGPEPLVLGRRTNPTLIQTFGHGMAAYVHATYPGGLHGFASWIAETRPTVLSIRSPGPWLEPVLRQYYCRTSSLYAGPHILVDKRLGHDVCVQVHDALREVWTPPAR